MTSIIKIKRSASTVVTSGSTTLNFGELCFTEIAGVRRFFIGDASNIALEIAGDIYAKLASPTFTGTPAAPTATTGTNTTQLATTAFVQQEVGTAVASTFKFKDVFDASTNANYPAAVIGDVYIVSVAGKIGGASGTVVEVGDTVYCKEANAGGTQASVGSKFAIVQVNTDPYTEGNGITITGLALSVKKDVTGGSNISKSINVSTNGIGISVDDSSVVENGSGQLSVGTLDCGTF